MDTVKLTPIPEDKKMTSWELGNNLEKIAKFLQDLPLSVIKDVEFSEQEAWGRIDGIITGVNNRLVELQDSINTSYAQVDDALSKHYYDTREKVNELNRKLKELPTLIEDPRIPYNVKELVDAAERISQLSPKQWERVRQLAEIFAWREK